MQYFPVNLLIAERKCVVIGGGRVAARKVASLLECGGVVEVISPDLTEELQEQRRQGRVLWRQRSYRPGDLAGAFLVIAATDAEEVQAAVFAEASAANQLINVADVPPRCNFILPAVVSRGDLVLAVSTAGKSPALARRIRKQLAEAYGDEYGTVVEIMGLLRPLVLALGLGHGRNKEIFTALLSDDFVAWVRGGDWLSLENHLQTVLGNRLEQGCLTKIKKMLDCRRELQC
ncbi:MAG: bifunctional precorrin-2 dehydrogenase/sirohydrochlorin ferrochelatase [Desulfobulbaceae bacterium]|nr:bifunctional precorrin-2 dehydrogenase/sirohydrochlorin ferrochelatase [Desulfobulbaceae bacterium]